MPVFCPIGPTYVASFVAASFQLVRKLTEAFSTTRRSSHRRLVSPAGPAEVSFAGTFAAGRIGGADLMGAKFQRSSSFSRSRLAVPLFRGGKFSTCPEVD
jgi:hypothetical protein